MDRDYYYLIYYLITILILILITFIISFIISFPKRHREIEEPAQVCTPWKGLSWS